MMKFKQLYFSEKIIYPQPDDFITISNQAINQIKKNNFNDVDIFWRGFNIKRIAAPVLTLDGEDRTNFRGSQNEISQIIIKKLNIKYPVFTSRDVQNGLFFGSPMVFVPIGTFKSWQSPLVTDLLHIDEKSDINEIVKSYKNTLSHVSKYEIIFDIPKYYLINLNQILFTLKKNIGNLNVFKKYNDVIDILSEYSSYIKKLRLLRS